MLGNSGENSEDSGYPGFIHREYLYSHGCRILKNI